MGHYLFLCLDKQTVFAIGLSFVSQSRKDIVMWEYNEHGSFFYMCMKILQISMTNQVLTWLTSGILTVQQENENFHTCQLTLKSCGGHPAFCCIGTGITLLGCEVNRNIEATTCPVCHKVCYHFQGGLFCNLEAIIVFKTQPLY